MYEIIIIFCLAVIFGILLRKWSLTKHPIIAEVESEPKLSDINITEDFLKRAEGLFQNKNYREAEKYYLKAAAKKPENSLIYGRLGVIYVHLNNSKDAKVALETAIKYSPENGFYQNNLGLVLYGLKRYKEALLYFENAVDIDEKIAKRWINLGLCLEKMGERERAKEAYNKAIKLEPKNEKCRELLEGLKKEGKFDNIKKK